MIETLKGFPPDTLAVKGRGFVSAIDYDLVVTPAVEQVMRHCDRVRVYFETAPDFVGVSPRAFWKDISLVARYFSRWKRIAIVTDARWIGLSAKVFSFAMPGRTKVFSVADADEARRWLDRDR